MNVKCLLNATRKADLYICNGNSVAEKVQENAYYRDAVKRLYVAYKIVYSFTEQVIQVHPAPSAALAIVQRSIDLED